MKSPARILVIAASFLLSLAPLRGLAAQPNRVLAGHWGCTSLQSADTIYVSSLWDGTATMPAVGAAFTDRLATKYGYKAGRVSCSRADMAGSTFAKIDADREKQFAQWEKSGKKVIRTGWTYGPAKKADTTAAAKPPATSP